MKSTKFTLDFKTIEKKLEAKRMAIGHGSLNQFILDRIFGECTVVLRNGEVVSMDDYCGKIEEATKCEHDFGNIKGGSCKKCGYNYQADILREDKSKKKQKVYGYPKEKSLGKSKSK